MPESTKLIQRLQASANGYPGFFPSEALVPEADAWLHGREDQNLVRAVTPAACLRPWNPSPATFSDSDILQADLIIELRDL